MTNQEVKHKLTLSPSGMGMEVSTALISKLEEKFYGPVE